MSLLSESKHTKKHHCGLLCFGTFVIFTPAPLNWRTQLLDILLHWQRLFSTPAAVCLSLLRMLGFLHRHGGRHPGTWRKQFFYVCVCQDDRKWWDSFGLPPLPIFTSSLGPGNWVTSGGRSGNPPLQNSHVKSHHLTVITACDGLHKSHIEIWHRCNQQQVERRSIWLARHLPWALVTLAELTDLFATFIVIITWSPALILVVPHNNNVCQSSFHPPSP